MQRSGPKPDQRGLNQRHGLYKPCVFTNVCSLSECAILMIVGRFTWFYYFLCCQKYLIFIMPMPVIKFYLFIFNYLLCFFFSLE
jgi:hypothetical protein